MAAARTIIESEPFKTARRLLPFDVKRLDEILIGVLWELSRRPQDFPWVPQTNKLLRYIVVEPFQPDTPTLCIWYTFDKHTVTLEHIDHDEPDDGR